MDNTPHAPPPPASSAVGHVLPAARARLVNSAATISIATRTNTILSSKIFKVILPIRLAEASTAVKTNVPRHRREVARSRTMSNDSRRRIDHRTLMYGACMRDATDGDRQDGEWSVAWLSSELRELRRQAGHPSLSDINKLTKHGPARATISELLAGQRKWAPPWETLSNVVQALIAHARDKNLGLDPRLANLEEWRRLHGLVVRDIERSKRNANKARLELIEQFSVLPPARCGGRRSTPSTI
ncbi:hypothetical protein ACFQ9X_37745 [Catenulispora yoronensis]